MHVKGSAPHIRRIPLPTKGLLLQKDKCEQCNARYSYVGTAFFCPCCGHNSIEKTFDTAISKVNKKVANIPKIVSAFLKENMKDEAEDMKRDIIEGGVSDCVTAFQFYCERVYKEKGGNETLKRNGFQSLDYGNKRWKKLFGEGYSEWLSDGEMNRLKSLNFLLISLTLAFTAILLTGTVKSYSHSSMQFRHWPFAGPFKAPPYPYPAP